MAELLLPKQIAWVRFPSPAPDSAIRHAVTALAEHCAGDHMVFAQTQVARDRLQAICLRLNVIQAQVVSALSPAVPGARCRRWRQAWPARPCAATCSSGLNHPSDRPDNRVR